MIGRLPIHALFGTALVALAMAACDTGDGKTLRPYDPADYPSQTTAPATVVDDGLDESNLGLPLPTSPTPSSEDAVSATTFQLAGPWLPGESIDARYTCDGENVAPALSWDAVPAGTAEIAIAMVDDSAVSDGQPFVHWVITGINPAETSLDEGDVPEQAVQALNYFGDAGYGGPCPPPGDDPHLYRLTAYALNNPLAVADGDTADEILDAIARAAIRATDLTGLYQR